MKATLLRTRHSFWWWAEQQAGHLCSLACRNKVSCYLDWLPALCQRRRYKAQNDLIDHIRKGPR